MYSPVLCWFSFSEWSGGPPKWIRMLGLCDKCPMNVFTIQVACCVSSWVYVYVFPERVVSFLTRPVLPAALLSNGQQLFSANAICQWVFPNATLIWLLLISLEALHVCVSTDICSRLVGKRSLLLAGSYWNGKQQNCRSVSAAKGQWNLLTITIFSVRRVNLKSELMHATLPAIGYLIMYVLIETRGGLLYLKITK